VIGMLPVTGITLPLISAGGSSLTLLLTAIGVLLNVSRFAR
jgi:cell division protein FtsW